jgi:hypothetical protein
LALHCTYVLFCYYFLIQPLFVPHRRKAIRVYLVHSPFL